MEELKVGDIEIFEHKGKQYVSMESLAARKNEMLRRVDKLKIPGAAKGYIAALIKIQYSGIE